MRVLILGSGQASWVIRGQQLGEAIDARVRTVPTDEDVQWAEIVVLVKRGGFTWLKRVRQAGTPLVWDPLDFWAQPTENALSAEDAQRRVRLAITAMRPALVIGATAAMAEATGGCYLPHHSWPGLSPTPPRPTVTTVGYQGNPRYLGQWHAVIAAVCDQRRWRFVVNPPDLCACDLLVAFRDGPWDGWMCREWKSGVKYVNALAAGRPILSQDCAAWRDIQPEGTLVASPQGLAAAMAYWADHDVRAAAYVDAADKAVAYTLPSVARRYTEILQQVMACAA